MTSPIPSSSTRKTAMRITSSLKAALLGTALLAAPPVLTPALTSALGQTLSMGISAPPASITCIAPERIINTWAADDLLAWTEAHRAA